MNRPRPKTRTRHDRTTATSRGWNWASLLAGKPVPRTRLLSVEQLEDRVTPSITSVFELDANTLTTATHDWDQVFADNNVVPPPSSGAIASAFVTDAVNSRADDIFTGGGSKDTQGIQNGPWLYTDAKPQAKDDITHAYAALYTDPSNGHSILYAGLDRYDNSGDATAGFWFFRNNIGEDPNVSGNGTGHFIGTHSDGDILLVSDFTTGGSTSTIKVFQWVGDDATGHLEAVTAAPGTTFAIVNSDPISVPWSYTNKSGQSQPAHGEFLEEGVDLTALGLTSCFASFLAETRSSQSPTATLSDFVIGSFPVCSVTGNPGVPGLSKVGDTFIHQLVVQNTGAMPLYLQNVTDDLLGDLVVDGVVQSPSGPITSINLNGFDPSVPLAPGDILTISVSRVTQATDPDPTVHTTSFVFNDKPDFSEDAISTKVTNTVNLFQPSATLTVTPSSPTAQHLGDPITYTFTVTNTSSADSPNLVLSTSNVNNFFTDTLLGNLEGTAIAAEGDGSIAPGDSFSFTVTRNVQAGDPTPLTDTANVAFTLAQNLGTFDNIISAQASASVTLLPHLLITKTITSGFPDVIHPGDTASFTITVTNDGAGAASNVVVTDQLPEPDLLSWTVDSSSFDTTSISTGDFLTASSSTLAAGATEAVTISALIPADLFGVPAAGGTGSLPGGPFELDGNALDDAAVAGDDWSNVLFGNGGTAFAHSFVTDAVNSRSDDIFTGGGSKDIQGIQNGPWLFTDSKPQAKDDITHAYAAMATDPSNGHTILYAGLDRFDNSGDATAGFWFFANPIGLSTNNPTSSGSPFTGTHSDGDILLVSDFTVGGSTSTIKVFRWVGNDATGSLVPVTAPAGTTFAIVNGAPINVPWSYENKSHQTRPAAGEFLEEGVDLTALGLGGCFSNFLAETCSSQSPTATLSDFVIGNFNTCRLDLPNTATVSATGLPTLTTDTVVITVVDGDMLLADSLPGEATASTLTAEQWQTVVAQAIDEWRAAGIDPQRLTDVSHMPVHFVDLPGAELGFASPGEIWIDSSAAGWGWSVNGAAGRMDPTTVVAHELGHLLGLEHSDGGVMGAALASGTSLIPQAVSLASATSSSIPVGATTAAPVVLAHAGLGSGPVQMTQPGVVGGFLAPPSAPAGVAFDLGTQSTLSLSTSTPVASWLDQGAIATTVPAFALPNFGLIRDNGNGMPGDDEYADQPAKPTTWFDLFDAPIELESMTLAGVWVGEAVGDSAADGSAAGDAGGGDGG